MDRPVLREDGRGEDVQTLQKALDDAGLSPGATQLLKADASVAAAAVNGQVTVGLSQQQFDALVSFTFNVGAGNFRGSTLLRRLNAGRFDAVPDQLRLWNKGGGVVLPGLVRRREAEARLFATGQYGD